MLGFWQDQFDTIDLSENDIVRLENFPHLNRLGTLLINKNRITRINPNIGGKIQTVLLLMWHH
jgi:U2 small nuclear ribonucleoprotein A'